MFRADSAVALPGMMSAKASSYRPDIDGLRCVAVLAVLAFHAWPRMVPSGFIGVDIFFVISGFLISGIILGETGSGTFTFKGFYARRVRRLFPALILVLIACWAGGWHLFAADAFQALGQEIASGIGFFANFLFWWKTDYFGVAAETRPLLHLWSLGVEEQFYLIWPAALLLARRYKGGIVGVLAVGLLVSFALNVARVEHHSTEVFFLPHTRLWELFLGALLAQLTLTGHAGQLAGDRTSIAGVGLLLAAFALIDDKRLFPGGWALLPTLGTVLIIAAGKDAWFNRTVLAARPLVYIGLISYPLYLWHWPVLAFTRSMSDGEITNTQLAIAIVVAFLLAILTYRFIELPFRRKRAPWQLTGLIMAALIVLGAGLLTHLREGFPSRFPQLVRQLASYQYPNYEVEYRVAACFLKPDQVAKDFVIGCVDPGFTASGTNFLLWGDSHAAHLLPGLRAASRTEDFAIAQFNSAGCPPIIGFLVPNRGNCEDINQYVLQQIQTLRPKIVVMSAHWPKYDKAPDFGRLADTIRSLRVSGVPRIIVVGPVPNWRPSLPEMLLKAYMKDPMHRLPERMQTSLNDMILETDTRLAAIARAVGAEYFSPMAVLCQEGACLTRLGDGPADLMAWDYGHLTANGSNFLVQRMLEERHPVRK
ncbi:acyltransferase family protein [Hylemonella sp. W303a]|uniref:acyltransferase family protein n=1 Tax=Hylemonella sp. W303a TaxID=3389873 RepID=UPI00396B4102